MGDAIIPRFRSIGNLAVLVILACLVGSLDVLGQQINPSPPFGASTPGAQRPTKAKPQTDRASSVAQRPRPKAVIREVARRISVGGGVLVLPEVAYYGVPVILDVPGIGFVEVSEDEYSRLYKQLSSSAQGQVDAAIASLRAIKAAEDAEIEAAQNAPRSGPGEVERDLSERISFGRPSQATQPSRR
jgi:hypothetical protein